MGKYFSKFPAIEYQGKIAKNILARPKVRAEISSGKTPYYDFKVPAGKYYDQISNEYYNNHDFTWLMYLTNNIIDPYYQVYLNDEDFESFIIKKYGSIAFARSVYVYWRHNYKTDKRELTSFQFDSLPINQKRYWQPVYTNIYVGPSKYIRKVSDETVSTNRIVKVTTSNVQDYNVDDEFITTDVLGNPAGGIVKSIDGNNLILQHVFSRIINGNEYSELVNTVTSVNSISADEIQYWEAVTLYDMEEEMNLQRQDIKMIDRSLTYQVEKDLKKAMNE